MVNSEGSFAVGWGVGWRVQEQNLGMVLSLVTSNLSYIFIFSCVSSKSFALNVKK